MKTAEYEFLTSDQNIQENKIYKELKTFLSQMVENGTISLASGYCISASDMVKTGLRQRGISSRLVECSLTITYHNQTPTRTDFIGFPNVKHPGQIDTHMVVVTETDPPFLIDAGISHRLPGNKPALIEPIYPVVRSQDQIIIEKMFDKEQLQFTYQEKTVQVFPQTYQKSILERIETDRKIFSNLSLLKILIVVALIISTANAIRGAYDFYSVYFSENSWGPKTLDGIDQRLHDLEKKIDKKL